MRALCVLHWTQLSSPSVIRTLSHSNGEMDGSHHAAPAGFTVKLNINDIMVVSPLTAPTYTDAISSAALTRPVSCTAVRYPRHRAG